MHSPAMTHALPLIRSRSNPLFRRFLAQKADREDELCLLEGPKLIEEALASGLEIVEAAASPRGEASERGPRVLAALRDRGAAVRRLHDDLLSALSEARTSQGLVALARRPRFDEEALFRGTPLLVVAAGIQDPGNLGGLLRTAEAAGATGAYLAAGTADPFAWKALRGSMGSAFRLPHQRGLDGIEILRRLRSRGVAVFATGAGAEQAYDRADFRGPSALVLGSEGAGLTEAMARGADHRLSIPMRGRAESLNVGVAAGVLLFEAARQRRMTMIGSER
jgi:RNA methyltransferase, TrmH family